MRVSFDLQEGFQDDEVTVSNKDTKLFSEKNISTRTQIGLAKSLEFELTGDKAKFTIAVPSRHLVEAKEIDLAAANVYVAVSITADNKLEWKVSDAPFMYM